ncbi:hypothetical protein [Massilia sp. DD77]|uniref:hypothetical protein n=1 Tax=Massilia sp. DD77 TaxID=3109349 RepID=UPI0030004DBE
MPQDDVSADKSSVLVRFIERLKKHPVTLIIVALGAAVAFAAALKQNVEQLAPKEDAPPLVRVQHFQVSGDAVSLMLMGKIDGKLKDLLGGRPIVWQNDIYRAAEALHRRFGRPLGANSFNESLSDAEAKSISSETPLISGAMQQSLGIPAEEAFAHLGQPIMGKDWQIAFVEEMTPLEISEAMASGEMQASTVQFSKLIGCDKVLHLLRSTDAAEQDLYAELAKGACRGMKFAVTARYLDTSCGGQGWEVILTLPQIRMDVLVVQNISDKPIKINKIVSPNHEPMRVGDGTLLKEDRLIIPTGLSLANSGGANLEPTPVFPLSRLRPLTTGLDRSISFVTTPEIDTGAAAEEDAVAPESLPSNDEATEGVEESESGESPGPNESAAPGQASSSESLPTGETGTTIDTVAVNGAEVPSAQPDGEVQPRTVTVFALTAREILQRYGDAQLLASSSASIAPDYLVADLEVNGRRIAVDPISAGGTYISNSFPGGSCPRLYLLTNDGALRGIGKILVGRNAKALLGSNRRHLTEWPEQIIVRELDPETSYLHDVSVVCERPDGSTFRAPGTLARSTKPEYPLTLKQGQKIAFGFAAPPVADECETIYVEVSGYYIETAIKVPKS